MFRLNSRRLFSLDGVYHICIIFFWSQLFCIDSLTVKKSIIKNDNEPSTKQLGNYKIEIDLVSTTDYNPTANFRKRNKRGAPFLLGMWGFCLNYPLCCDDEGEDTCPFFCPVCPIKRDICKSSWEFNIHDGIISLYKYIVR